MRWVSEYLLQAECVVAVLILKHMKVTISKDDIMSGVVCDTPRRSEGWSDPSVIENLNVS